MGDDTHANDDYADPSSASARPPVPQAFFPDESAGEAAVDEGPTLKELQERAKELDIDGRSSMNKEELAAAIAEAESTPA